jgi:hypothetical protein
MVNTHVSSSTLSRACIAPVLLALSVQAQAIDLTIETGPLGFSYNDAQIPNSSAGDRFDLLELTGAGPVPYVRLSVEETFAQRHTVRVLYAPVSIEGTGTLSEPTRFNGETFAADTPIEGLYKFNTYRLTYRYTFLDDHRWTLGAGITALVRDANIRLTQGSTKADDPNLGVVPLLHFNAKRYLNEQVTLEFDIDALGSPQGRAIDAAFIANYQWNDVVTVRAGYRTLEGGGGGGVYTFAWLHYGVVGATLHW